MHARRLIVLLALLPWIVACRVTGERPQPDGPRSVEYEGARVAWVNRGEGSQALLFVHGWGGARGVWSAQLQGLQPWRRIALDLPGHGESDVPRREYTAGYLAESLRAVLDDAAVERAVLVAHSNGTVVAREFLRRHPGRVAGLVVVDGPLRSFFDDPEQGRAFVAPLAGPDGHAWLERTVDAMLAPMRSAAERARVRAIMLATPRRVLQSSFEGTLAPELWREERLGVPLLVVNARSPFWDEGYRALVERLAPGAQYELLDGVSHFLMLDEPQRFDALVRGFLLRTNPFAATR